MLPYLFVLLAIAVRFMPHPFGFTPVAASLLFFGARGQKRMLWMPFVLLAATDVVLTKWYWAYPFTYDHFITFAWYAGILFLGTALRKNSGWLRVVGAALASSLSFFLISNFAVWAAQNMYPKTFAGLLTCYTVGLPFFQRSAEGDMLFTLAMFATPLALKAISEAFSGADHSAAA